MDKIATILNGVRPEVDFSAGGRDFFDSGMLDSFDLTQLISALEVEYGVTIEGADIVPENFQSISAICSLLQKYGVETYA